MNDAAAPVLPVATNVRASLPRIQHGSALPGVLAIVAIAVGARMLSRFTGAIPDVVLALVAGMLLRNSLGLPEGVRPGIAFTLRYVLRAAIILFGAGLTFAAIVGVGASTLALVGVCFIVAVGIGLLLARVFALSGVVGILIGAGTAICGGSAILALGPLVRAKDAEVAYAITTIFTFNIVALLVYPALGHVLQLSQTAFGSWSGTAVNDTSVVIATGYLYGVKAGAVATIVKLTRTVLLVPFAVAVGLIYDTRITQTAHGDARKAESKLWRRVFVTFPWFIAGFVVMAALNTWGVFPSAVARGLTDSAGFLIVMVLAGVGLNVDIVEVRRLGPRPLVCGVALASMMAVVSLSLIRVLHIG